MQTTNQIIINEAIEALVKITGTPDQSLEEIYNHFSSNLNTLLKRRKNNLICATVGVGTGTAGIVTGVIYYNNRKL